MKKRVRRLWRITALISCWLLLDHISSFAQQDAEAGRSIGGVSTQGNLIVVELNEGALGATNLFDLNGHTLRFTPEGSRFRVDNGSLHWDSDFGAELTGAEVNLNQFAFPFSGKSWHSLSVGTTGSISFGRAEDHRGADPYGHVDGGVATSIGRFDSLTDAAATLIKSAPAICVYLKPRMSGPHYVKELRDRVVITWDVSEPFGGLLDFTWSKTTNRFQAVLHRDGSIDMSYKEMSAKDGIVGVYPTLTNGETASSVHFSSLTSKGGSFAAMYEAFHYLALPRPEDLSCTVIKALGDRFDFLAYYSDFRVDGQEASTPSDGPVGGHLTGIGDTQHDQTPEILASRCTQGRFQLGFAQPVFTGSNEMQPGPPAGTPPGNSHDITRHLPELAEGSPDRNPRPYNYAIGHLGHEVGHRWSAYVSAKVNDQIVSLGSWPHWARELQAPVPFPYSLPTEASTLGGAVWQDNFDGTYTQLRDGYFIPAAGYSYLDLYLMGLISAAEVPDFFILKNLVRIANDANGHPIFKAERIKLTVQDVIAAEGPRSPDVDHSQRKFNTGIVVVVEHGQKPSRELLEQANGIRQQWIDYWATATGHRASMTADPH